MASVVLPVDRNGVSANAPLHVAVALGAVPGWRSFRKFGLNPSVSSGSVLEDVWSGGGQRTLPTSAGVATFVSTSTSDRAGASGGIKMMIEGLDGNYVEVSEEVTLDGTSSGVTTQTFLRVNRMYLTSAGVSATNVGTISAVVDGTSQAIISAGYGQTVNVGYTVPSSHSVYITSYSYEVGRMPAAADINVFGQVRLFGTNAWRTLSNIYLDTGSTYSSTPEIALVMPAKTDLRVVTSSTGATQMAAVYTGYLVDDAYLTKGIYV